MPVFIRDRLAARIITLIVSLPIIAFSSHLLIYTLPKNLDRRYPDLIPLSYDYWDRGNKLVSMILSSSIGLFVGYWLYKPKGYPEGFCPSCGYNMRGAVGEPPYTCPECGGVCTRS